MPMFGVMREIFSREFGVIRDEEDFFSVARTTPFVAGLVLARLGIVLVTWLGLIGKWDITQRERKNMMMMVRYYL